MSKILLQTTITAHPDDWSITRFALLAAELRAAGHDVTARDRAVHGANDPILSRLDDSDFDQLWLLAVDTGDGLTDTETAAIVRFRENGGGVLTARDHQDLGSCLLGLGSLGEVNHFHQRNPDPARARDDQDTPAISWPNYHSGANGDYQPVFAMAPVHDLLRTGASGSGRIEWFPAHPHEGAVSACAPFATVVAQGRSIVSGRRFNLAVALDGEVAADGRTMGRALAESTFHHFADYNWDLDRGAPSFVSESPGTQIKADPARLTTYLNYIRNIATWLHPITAEGR
ncbi:hypothetical protein LTV02_12335 [Nocardia yamanashiensis]|uniref:hypothetical protein n=1 Tax=Nocardia yamanashiensis TaxID=209247 RepID=UPI001E38767E|nr:hypothetical protein [Nocardia yamanashiensis]UGT44120.1 hypothetical protein LTV02_12335 [Nocardia yamanashiensis]